MNPLSPSSSQLKALLSAPCSECEAPGSATVWCGCGAGICPSCLSRHGRKCKTRTKTPLEISKFSCTCLLRGADLYAMCCGMANCETCTYKHMGHPELQIRKDDISTRRYERVDADSQAAMLNYFDKLVTEQKTEVETTRKERSAVEAAKKAADDEIISLKDLVNGMRSEAIKDESVITSLSSEVERLFQKDKESQQLIEQLTRKLAQFEENVIQNVVVATTNKRKGRGGSKPHQNSLLSVLKKTLEMHSEEESNQVYKAATIEYCKMNPTQSEPSVKTWQTIHSRLRNGI